MGVSKGDTRSSDNGSFELGFGFRVQSSVYGLQLESQGFIKCLGSALGSLV